MAHIAKSNMGICFSLSFCEARHMNFNLYFFIFFGYSTTGLHREWEFPFPILPVESHGSGNKNGNCNKGMGMIHQTVYVIVYCLFLENVFCTSVRLTMFELRIVRCRNFYGRELEFDKKI